MASGTVAKTNAKGHDVIVAGTAIFAVTHGIHGDGCRTSFHFENIIMAGIATVKNSMFPVLEYRWGKRLQSALILPFKLNIAGC